jgi:hypothetical protein
MSNNDTSTTLEKAGVKTPEKAIVIPHVEPQSFTFTIEGTTPLIMHRFGETPRESIRKKKGGEAKRGHGIHDPFAEFVDCFHLLPGAELPEGTLEIGEHWDNLPNTFGFSAGGIKDCAATATRYITGLKGTEAKGAFHVEVPFPGVNLVPITRFSKVVMVEDMIRLQGKSADLRYRPYFHDWEMDITVTFDPDFISPEIILGLFSKGGFGNGLGDWRPQKGGPYGRFRLKPTESKS